MRPTGSGPADPTAAVVVAVLTFRRPAGLAAVLPALVREAGRVAAEGTPAWVLVVDNDPDASAREAVSGWAGRGVDYVCEPRPGIAAARNRALDHAVDAAALVFIDDDEVPSEGWLTALVAQWRAADVVAVAGPVTSRFTGPVDPWIAAGGFFDRPRRTSGTQLAGAATNNLLLDLGRLRTVGLRFDEGFGLTGGSDTMLTHALVARGERIVWCDDAVVVEDVPASRTTRPWVLRRALRAGTVWSRVVLALSAGRRRRTLARIDLTLRGLKRLAVGASGWAGGAVTRDLGRRARGARDLASGLGALLGAWGYVYTEYRRPSVSR